MKNLFKNKILATTLLIVTPIIFLYYISQNFNTIIYQQSENDSLFSIPNAGAFYDQKKVVSSLPVRLKIPIIKVDAVIENIGLAKDGSVGVPIGPKTAAWFNLSPNPGISGSSIISGHSGWKNGIPAVFDNLYKLKIGDKIYVEGNKGEITTFIVREIKKYDPKADARDVFISTDGKSHLNLITCTGIWNIISKSRSQRLVVFTDKE